MSRSCACTLQAWPGRAVHKETEELLRSRATWIRAQAQRVPKQRWLRAAICAAGSKHPNKIRPTSYSRYWRSQRPAPGRGTTGCSFLFLHRINQYEEDRASHHWKVKAFCGDFLGFQPATLHSHHWKVKAPA